MGADITAVPPVGICFKVVIDGHDLGAWQTCDGLALEVTVEQKEEGGNNFFVHQLPGQLKYANIKLSRTINADTAKVAGWFASMAVGIRRCSAEITVMTPQLTKVASWHLDAAFPVKWTGPSLSTDASKAATETLELAHHGFLPGSGGSA